MERKAGIRFNMENYVAIDMDSMTLTEVTPEETKTYEIGGADIEKKRLYTNPDTSVQMTADTLFVESEIEGYQYLVFVVTDIAGTYEVEEWCEIAPLKEHSGQFVISMPISDGLWARKIYRSSGNVKPSVNVYKIGATTENRDACIVKFVDAVKGVK